MAASNSTNSTKRKNGSSHDLPLPPRIAGEVLPDGVGAQTDSPDARGQDGREVFQRGVRHVRGVPRASGRGRRLAKLPVPPRVVDAILRRRARVEVRAI